MRKYTNLLIVVICLSGVVLSLAGCAIRGSSVAESRQKTVEALRAIQPTNIPENLKKENSAKMGTEFDVNDYFSVLTHLSMEPGYVLDYVYVYNKLFGGRPIIYTRKVDQRPFADYSEYDKYRKEAGENGKADTVYGFVALIITGDKSAFDDKIRVDGTEESFFEYTVLQIMGGQFYLYWHALYDDAVVISSRESLSRILFGAPNTLQSGLPPEVQKQAGKLDIAPIIELHDDVAIVKVVVFTQWRGFIQDTFTINRQPPHSITHEWNVVVKYNSGIIF